VTEAVRLPARGGTLTRREAIDVLRRHLLQLTDAEHSICLVASEHGIFCGGFRRFGEGEFRERYREVVARRGLSRRQQEYLANSWQLARQLAENVALACDAQAIEHDTCRGWDDFTNMELARFLRELLAVEVDVVADVAAESQPALSR
jgi:hypothetical protein